MRGGEIIMSKKIIYAVGMGAAALIVAAGVAFAQTASPTASPTATATPTPIPTAIPSAAPSTGFGGM